MKIKRAVLSVVIAGVFFSVPVQADRCESGGCCDGWIRGFNTYKSTLVPKIATDLSNIIANMTDSVLKTRLTDRITRMTEENTQMNSAGPLEIGAVLVTGLIAMVTLL